MSTENDPPDDHSRTMQPISAGEATLGALAPAVSLVDDAYWAKRDAEVAAERASEQRKEAADALKHRAGVLKASGQFPVRAVENAMDPRETTALASAKKFLTGERSVLVLAGGVGTGKTTGSAWIALHSATENSAFIGAAELEGRGRYDDTLRTWLRTKTMLVIDDLGAEVLDGRMNFQSLLDEIINLFYGDRKRIVITTNLRLKTTDDKKPQFDKRYGERIASRLFEVGIWTDCGATDLRRVPPKATP